MLLMQRKLQISINRELYKGVNVNALRKLKSIKEGTSPYDIWDIDLNLDNTVDILDIIIMINIILNEYSPTEFEILIADLNYDGNINIQDIMLVEKNENYRYR